MVNMVNMVNVVNNRPSSLRIAIFNCFLASLSLPRCDAFQPVAQLWYNGCNLDLDGDGAFRFADAVYAAEIIANGRTFDTNVCRNGDFNGDGQVSNEDAVFLAIAWSNGLPWSQSDQPPSQASTHQNRNCHERCMVENSPTRPTWVVTRADQFRCLDMCNSGN